MRAHQVSFGVRSPDRYQQLAEAWAALAGPANAVSSAEVVLLAVPGAAVAGVLSAIAGQLAGKIVLDATNSFGGGPMNCQQAVAEAAPGAAYFRAFNTLGWENFANPEFPGGERADLFYAGPDGPPRDKVEALISDVGLRPVWVGGPEHAETVDGVARLWFALALGRQRGRHTAFRTLTD
jgi:predicted dinucleotide-binding enzyme